MKKGESKPQEWPLLAEAGTKQGELWTSKSQLLLREITMIKKTPINSRVSFDHA